jgi:hypothetical protein
MTAIGRLFLRSPDLEADIRGRRRSRSLRRSHVRITGLDSWSSLYCARDSRGPNDIYWIHLCRRRCAVDRLASGGTFRRGHAQGAPINETGSRQSPQIGFDRWQVRRAWWHSTPPCDRHHLMSAFGTKRTSVLTLPTSACGGKADIARTRLKRLQF